MRVTAKGQVTIPQEIRDRFGLHPGTDVSFTVRGETVRLERTPGRGRGKPLVERMRGTGRIGLSTDEIMRLTRG
ncbi:MAG: AbrB/MazE/SpoVT family DNA-binding domain-containing protein [Gaiellales bacterium]